jgi:molecular chaperone DnaK
VFEVRATAGDNDLGGDDFDDCLLKYVAERYEADEGVDLRRDPMALQRLRDEVERIKMELSTAEESRLNIPFVTADKTGPKHLDIAVSRELFEDLIRNRVEQLRAPFRTSMGDIGLDPGRIDQVLLVGGSTRVPLVQQVIAEMVGETVIRGVNPDEMVALGAAIQGGILAGEKRGVVLVDVTPLTLGIEVEGGISAPVIPRNTPIPASHTRLFTTISENQKVVEVKVLQGERRQADANMLLGSFSLGGVRPAAKGEPRIEVRFDIDVDGVVNVSARDLDTGSDQAITVSGTTGLSEEEVAELVRQAELYWEQDQEFEEKARWMARVDGLLEAADARIGKDIDVLASAERQALFDDLKGAVADLREARQEEDMEKMHQLVQSIKFIVDELEAG